VFSTLQNEGRIPELDRGHEDSSFQGAESASPIERKLEACMRLKGGFHGATDPEDYAERVRKSTFPGETFRVLKKKRSANSANTAPAT